MRISIFLSITMLLLVSACGQRGVELSTVPHNETSALQSDKIEETLNGFQKDFDAINVKVNLHKIPVTVGELNPQRWGECHFDANKNGRAIVLGPKVFDNFFNFDDSVSMSTLEIVLLHEIGHCYFGRTHTKEDIDFHGKRYMMGDEIFIPGYGAYRKILAGYNIPVSVMKPGSIQLPKAFRKYYVSEVAKKSHLSQVEDLPGFNTFEELVDNNSPLKEIDAPITSGEVKILYPCSVVETLPLEKEEHEKVIFSDTPQGQLFKAGVILRRRTSADGSDITVKYRKNGTIKLSETGYNHLKQTAGELKCEADVNYDEVSPKFISSCSYKMDGLSIKQEHVDFLTTVFVPNTILMTPFTPYEVESTSWKMKVPGLAKKATVEMWKFRNECILEVSAKFEGMDTAVPTLSKLKASISAEPSPVQGNKTGRVLEINTL